MQNEKVNVVSQHVIPAINATVRSVNNISNQSLFEPNASENIIILDEDLQCFNNIYTPPGMEENLNTILENQKTIITNQNTIMQKIQHIGNKENQELIIQQLAKSEVTLDTLGNYVTLSSSNESSALLQRGNIEEQVIEQISTPSELDELEKKLQNKAIMDDYVEKLNYVCGKKGSGNGINNSYILVDRVFSRKLMTLCSWAGGARDKKEKVPFKMYKNIISLFFKVIHLFDKDFSLKDCEDFLKNVIRNSTRRYQSKEIRKSAVKRRPKNLNYNTKGQENVNAIAQNENSKNLGVENQEKEMNVEDEFEQEENAVEKCTGEENDASDEDDDV